MLMLEFLFKFLKNDFWELIDSKEKSSWICVVSFTVECVLCHFYLNFVSELEDTLPNNSEEVFDVPDFCMSPKREVVPFGSLSSYSERYKLDSDTQELGSICFDNEGTSQIFFFFKELFLSDNSLLNKH